MPGYGPFKHRSMARSRRRRDELPCARSIAAASFPLSADCAPGPRPRRSRVRPDEGRESPRRACPPGTRNRLRLQMSMGIIQSLYSCTTARRAWAGDVVELITACMPMSVALIIRRRFAYEDNAVTYLARLYDCGRSLRAHHRLWKDATEIAETRRKTGSITGNDPAKTWQAASISNVLRRARMVILSAHGLSEDHNA